MSALGQKRTFRSAIAMSALLPKADILCAERYVRSSHVTLARRSGRKRCIEAIKGPQAAT
jgi:hypothetical protein